MLTGKYRNAHLNTTLFKYIACKISASPYIFLYTTVTRTCSYTHALPLNCAGCEVRCGQSADTIINSRGCAEPKEERKGFYNAAGRLIGALLHSPSTTLLQTHTGRFSVLESRENAKPLLLLHAFVQVILPYHTKAISRYLNPVFLISIKSENSTSASKSRV